MKTHRLLLATVWLIGGVALWVMSAPLLRQAPLAGPRAAGRTAVTIQACTDTVAGGEVTVDWVFLGGPPGGLGYDIRYSFADPNTWYVTDDFAGIFRSEDNGLTWFPSSEGIPRQYGETGDRIPTFSLTVDPHDPQTLWAGTDGTGHIYRSVDGGQTWAERDEGVEFSGYDALSFRGFTVDPISSEIVYAMAETALEIQGAPRRYTGGRVYKTTDGGAYWSILWDGGYDSSLARYMWINPRAPGDPNDDILYVSTGIFDRTAVNEGDPVTDPDFFGGLGVLKSMDGGQTWVVQGEASGLELLYIGSLYMDPLDPNTLLAAAGKIIAGAAVDPIRQSGHAPGGVYRTTDGGEQWAKVLESTGPQLLEALTSVEICTPPFSNVAYAGSDQGFYRSEDAGTTWALVSEGPTGWGPPGVQSGWPIDLQCDPRDPDRVFANNYDGGNFLSEDGGHTWQNASQGYSGAQVYGVSVAPGWPARAFACGRSGPWRSDDGGLTWIGVRYPAEYVPYFECTTLVADPSQPERLLLGSRDGGIVQESLDRGLTWHHLWPPLDQNGEPVLEIGGGASDIVFAPANPARVYASLSPKCFYEHQPCEPGNGVLISSDGGETWEQTADPNLAEAAVFDLAVHPFDFDVLYAATSSGLFRSADGGSSWETVAIADQPTGASVRAVAIDPLDANHVLAALDGLWNLPGVVPGVYISRDGGSSWEPAYSGLVPESSIHRIVFDPVNPQIAYTSDWASGVYRSDDGGETWLQTNPGLTMRSVLGLDISSDGQHLYAGTNGGAVFRLDLNGEPPAVPRYIYLPLVEK